MGQVASRARRKSLQTEGRKSSGRKKSLLASVRHVTENIKRRESCASLRERLDSGGSTDNVSFSSTDKQLITETWKKLNDKGNNYVHDIISKSWLTAAERCPIWVWGLVGIDEGNQENAKNNRQFQAMITSAHAFFHELISKHSLDMEQIRQKSHALGVRHRNYMSFGYQKTYWDCFWVAITDGIVQAIQESLKGRTFSKKSRVYSPSGLSDTMCAWKKFFRFVVEEINRGYCGEVSHVRLSLTSSILSMDWSARRHSSRASGSIRTSLLNNANWSPSPNSSPRHSWHLRPPPGITPRRCNSPRPSLTPSIDIASYIPGDRKNTPPKKPPPLKKVVSTASLGFYAARMRARHDSDKSDSSQRSWGGGKTTNNPGPAFRCSVTVLAAD